MTTLDVRGLSVEVGGKTVVSDLSFTLRAGDKMGVVGRNGAGKTSLLKVLGGEDLPLHGTVTRTGAIGYLRQDPRQHRADDHVTGLEHILAARDLVDLARRLEKARIQLEESHARHERRAVRAPGGGVPGARWLRGRVRGANADRGPRPGERPPGAPGACAVRRRAPTSGARADPVRRERPADAGRADEPPGCRREALADEVPGVVPRRADRGQPRPEAARRVDHPDPARRSRSGRRVPRNVLAVPEGALGG